MKKPLVYYRTGLGTDPVNGDMCGARKYLEQLASLLSADLVVRAWDDDRAKADFAMKYDEHEFTILGGHSHGSDAALQQADAMIPKSLGAGFFLDDCPPWKPLDQLLPAREAPEACRSGLAVWQRNSQPAGRSFNPRAGFYCFDATGWEPRLGHIDYPMLGLSSIAGAESVWHWVFISVLRSYASHKLGEL